MYGPKPAGFWTRHISQNPDHSYDLLHRGRRYKVIKEFQDYDRVVHKPGEEWIFLGHAFNPHEEGLSLFVSLDGEQEWMIRLQSLPESQGGILDNLAAYLRAVFRLP